MLIIWLASTALPRQSFSAEVRFIGYLAKEQIDDRFSGYTDGSGTHFEEGAMVFELSGVLNSGDAGRS